MGVCIRINEVKINFSGCREREVYATTVYFIKYGCSCSFRPILSFSVEAFLHGTWEWAQRQGRIILLWNYSN